MATDFVRAYDPASRSDISVSRGFAAATGLRVLDKPAVDRYGKPLPAKRHEPIGAPRPRRSTPQNSPAPAGEGQADEATSSTEANEEATS